MTSNKNLPELTIQNLLDAGAHFGHQKFRRNPKMESYIYDTVDNIDRIDLSITLPLFNLALNNIYDVIARNGKVLFVCTKMQVKDVVAEYAEKCGQYYVTNKWSGGTLTNWNTIYHKSIKELDSLEKRLNDPIKLEDLTKKEILKLTKKKDKLERLFGGIKTMRGKPDLMIVIDINKEKTAIKEALKLKIPIVAFVDTNCNPDNVDYLIPANDDAIRSIKFYCKILSDTILLAMQEALAKSGIDVNLENANLPDKKRNAKPQKSTNRFSANQEMANKMKKEAANNKQEDISKNNANTSDNSKENIEQKSQ